jgi:hypothetical protein
MLAVLIAIDAQSALGRPLTLRFASHDAPELGHFGGHHWPGVLAVMPDFALDFFGGGFAGQITAPRTGFSVLAAKEAGFSSDPAKRAIFADARVRIWAGPLSAADPHDARLFSLRFDGRIAAEPEIDDAARVARFEAAVQDSWADDPLLELFAGTGGIEGPVDLTGQPKPLVLGNARFCGGVLIDNVDNIWMVSNGPVEAVNAVYDRLASLGVSSGNHADLAALLAAEIPNGSWATCLALGLVRLGAPPDGRVSFDVSGSNAGTGGYVRRPGAIIRRLADLAGGTVNAASLAALDETRPYNLAFQIRDQTTAREAIGQIADSVAAVAGVSLTGELFAQPLGLVAAAEALNGDGTSPLAVAATEELAKDAPAWRLATEAELTFELHNADEAAFSYRWQGEYSADRVYRLDDVVTGPDSAAWAYINAVPAAGEALPEWPTEANSHWRLFQAPGGAGISIDGEGEIQGIATGNGTPVNNGSVVLQGVESARPGGGGNFVGQLFAATDTGEVTRWNGTSWEPTSDITSAAVREIEPEFAVIEIRRFGLGNVGNRTVSHFTRRGGVAIDGGTWSLTQVLLGAGGATVHPDTGLVTLSDVSQSGSYTIRYVHTDDVPTDLKMNVSFIDQAATVRSITASPSVVSWFQSSTSSRTVTHSAVEGSSTLTGGTWTLESVSAGISASINSSTGTVTVSGAANDGSYRVRYTHTDTEETELVMNLVYYPASDSGQPSNPDFNVP